jgi:uncharacterized membrane protein
MNTETARVEAFSDGVYAIAITLLILEIKVPQPGAVPLYTQLLRQWPSYASYFISFAFIGIMWINHHRMFTHIRRSDNNLMLLNLLLLLGVTTVPFPTAVLAAYLGHPGERTAAFVYNGMYLLIAFAFNALWRYAASAKHHLLAHDVDADAVARITRQYSFGPIPYLICFALAYINVRLSLVGNMALACFFALPPSMMRPSRHD